MTFVNRETEDQMSQVGSKCEVGENEGCGVLFFEGSKSYRPCGQKAIAIRNAQTHQRQDEVLASVMSREDNLLFMFDMAM